MTDTVLPRLDTDEETATRLLSDVTCSYIVGLLQESRECKEGQAQADWAVQTAFRTLARYAEVSEPQEVHRMLTDIGMLFDHQAVKDVLSGD